MDSETHTLAAQSYRGEWCSGLKASAWSWWPCPDRWPPCAPSANRWAPCPRSSLGKFAGGAADPWSPWPRGAAAWRSVNQTETGEDKKIINTLEIRQCLVWYRKAGLLLTHGGSMSKSQDSEVREPLSLWWVCGIEYGINNETYNLYVSF